MCRSQLEGGRICPGSKKMNTARRAVSRLSAELKDDSISDERRSMLTGKLHKNMERVSEVAYEHSQIPVPEHLLKTGEEFNSGEREWGFVTNDESAYDATKVLPAVNREFAEEVGYHYLNMDEESRALGDWDGGPYGKPAGGVWLSPVADDGLTEWEQNLDSDGVSEAPQWSQNEGKWNRGGRYTATLAPDARVLSIETPEDYYAAVDACHRDVPDMMGGQETARGLDYSKLNVDAVYISRNASKGSAFGTEVREGYEKLGGWDVDSVVVLRPQSVTMTEADAPRLSPEELETQREEHLNRLRTELAGSASAAVVEEPIATRKGGVSNDDGAWSTDERDDLDEWDDDDSSGSYEDEESIDSLMAKLGIGGNDDDEFDDDDDFSDDSRWN